MVFVRMKWYICLSLLFLGGVFMLGFHAGLSKGEEATTDEMTTDEMTTDETTASGDDDDDDDEEEDKDRIETCDCSHQCAPRINIQTSGFRGNCPKPPNPPKPTCPLCPTCPPATTPTISTTTTTEQTTEETTSPVTSGPCPPGYELVGSITDKCYMILEEFNEGGSGLDAADCTGGGAHIAIRGDVASELSTVQGWAVTKLGSIVIPFWTSGFGSSGGFKWDSSDAAFITLGSYTWRNGEPSNSAATCIYMLSGSNSLDHAPCSDFAYFSICQYVIV